MKTLGLRSLIRFFLFTFLLSISISSFAENQIERPLALVYKGKGACKLCIVGAVKVARLAGFDVKLVAAGTTDYSIFDGAKLWIQPGGHSKAEAKSMGPALMQKVRDFVNEGGGYVGFCAGAFISTARISSDEPARVGLGLIPGETSSHHEEDKDAWQIEKVITPDGDRWVYFAGGPQFKITDEELQAVDGKIIARSEDGQIEGIESHYGKGKVAVAGFHPEANALWKYSGLALNNTYLSNLIWLSKSIKAKKLDSYVFKKSSFFISRDPDGSDYDYAVEMIRFVTSP